MEAVAAAMAAAGVAKKAQAAASASLPTSALNAKGVRNADAEYFAATDKCLLFELSKSPVVTRALKNCAFDRGGRLIVPGQYEWLTPGSVMDRKHALGPTTAAKDSIYNYVHDAPALGFTVAFVSYVQTWDAWVKDRAPKEHLHRFLGGTRSEDGKNWYARCVVVYQDEVAAGFDPQRYRVDPTGLARKADVKSVDLTEEPQTERAHARKNANLCVLTGLNHVQVQPSVYPLPLAVEACPDLGPDSGLTRLPRSGRIVEAGTAFVHGTQIMQHEMHAMIKSVLTEAEQSYAVDIVMRFMIEFKDQPADALNDAICPLAFLESDDAAFGYCPASHGMYVSYRWDEVKLRELIRTCCSVAWDVARESWGMHPTLGAWLRADKARVERVMTDYLYTIVYGIFYPASLKGGPFDAHSRSLTDQIIAERDERVDRACKVLVPAHMDKTQLAAAIADCREGYTDGFGSSAPLPSRRRSKADPMQVEEIELTHADDKLQDDDEKKDPLRRCTARLPKKRMAEDLEESSDSDESSGVDDMSESSESDDSEDDVPLLKRQRQAPTEAKPVEEKPTEQEENDSDSGDDQPLVQRRKIDPLFVDHALAGGRVDGSIVLTERHGVSCSRSGAKYRAEDAEVVQTFTFDVVGTQLKAKAKFDAAVRAAENVHAGFDYSALLEVLTWGHLFLIAKHKAGDAEERGDADDAAFLESIAALLAGGENGINEVRVMAGPDGVAYTQRCALASFFACATVRDDKFEKTDIEKVFEWRTNVLHKLLDKDESGAVASLLGKKRKKADDDDDDDDDDDRRGPDVARVAELVMWISRRHDEYMTDARADADQVQMEAVARVARMRKNLQAAQSEAAAAAAANAETDKAVARAQARLIQAESRLAKTTALVDAAYAAPEVRVVDDCDSDSDGEEMAEDEEKAAEELDAKLTEMHAYVLNGAELADRQMVKWLYELAEMDYELAYDATFLAFVHMLAVKYRGQWDDTYTPPVRPDEFAIETREGMLAEFARRRQAAAEAAAEAADDDAPLR